MVGEKHKNEEEGTEEGRKEYGVKTLGGGTPPNFKFKTISKNRHFQREQKRSNQHHNQRQQLTAHSVILIPSIHIQVHFQTKMTTVTATASVLGYTQNAIKKLNESRALLDQYVQHQTSKIDAIHQRNQLAYNQETNRIKSSMDSLKNIQQQRGHADAEGDGSEEDKENTVNGIVQQQKSLAERQMDMERQLANLHLEQKGVQKSLNGEYPVQYCLYDTISFMTMNSCNISHTIIHACSRNCNVMQHYIIATSQEEKVAFTKAEQVRKSKERIEKAKQVTVEELTIAVCKYRELGLDFVKGENGALLFNFNKIDERDCDRVFSFRLLITEGDQYLVQDCAPVLREEVVMRLEEELNRTEDYPSFMRGIRNAFKNYVLEEEDAE